MSDQPHGGCSLNSNFFMVWKNLVITLPCWHGVPIWCMFLYITHPQTRQNLVFGRQNIREGGEGFFLKS